MRTMLRRMLSAGSQEQELPEGVTPLIGVLLVPERHRIYTPDDDRMWDLANVTVSKVGGASELTLVDGERSRILPLGPSGSVLGIDTRPGEDAVDSIVREAVA
jgi:1,6-anhydro-N-acetylmuramate kinase